MRLDDSFQEVIYLWVKKTKFTKTMACLFIYHHLITNGKVRKVDIEYYLELDNRVTIYNYIVELKIFLAELANITNEMIIIVYDNETKEFYLEKGEEQ